MLGNLVAHAAATLYVNLLKKKIKLLAARSTVGAKQYFNYLGLAVGVGAKVMHLAFVAALGKVVILVPRYAGYIKTFGVAYACFAVKVNHVVGGALVVLLEHRCVYN